MQIIMVCQSTRPVSQSKGGDKGEKHADRSHCEIRSSQKAVAPADARGCRNDDRLRATIFTDRVVCIFTHG